MRRKLFIVVGVMILFTLYFWGHNIEPGRTALIRGLMSFLRIALDMGAVLLLLACGGTLGRFALHRLDITPLAIVERLVVEVLLGLGLISLTACVLGLLGLFNAVIWGVVLLATAFCYRYLKAWLGDVRAFATNRGARLTIWEMFCRVIIIVLMASALMIALAPPTGWDTLYYHLVIPQRYVQTGAIGQHTDLHFFGFPQNMEVLYGLLMIATGAGRAAAVLHWMMGLMNFLVIGSLVQRYASRSAAYTITLVMVGSYNLWLLLGWAYIDVALMTYSAAIVCVLLVWRAGGDQQMGWLMLAGGLGGLAAGVKYTAAPLILAMIVFVVLNNPRAALRNLFILGIFGAVAFVPWAAKGLLLYHNPLYPYLFGGVSWDAVRGMNFSAGGSGLLYETGLLPLQIPVLPLTATIFGVDKRSPYSFTTGPFLLMLPFLLWAGWSYLRAETQSLVRALLPMAIVCLAYWMLLASLSGIGSQTRLMLVALPIAAILGAMGYHSLEQMPSKPLNILFIVQAAIVMGLLLGGFDYLTHFASSNVLAYHAGVIDEDTYLEYNVGLLYQAMEAMEETVPQGSYVKFLWEGKSYYCPQGITCEPDKLFDAWAWPIQQGKSPQEVLEQWRADGVTHFLFYDIPGLPDGYTFWLNIHPFFYEQNELFPDYFFDTVEEVWSDGVGYTLYTWQDEQN
ncbi:hypothetical protein G4Y79_08285 [Phototrophicus methaneseepsis]|uniref:Glycosyltransferase RgtA/B/C/D-like domain-containing protein n=2 Tax=Phototrophicus methaneseepsis TaxID=2710758 RepID=A0A7S8IG99_9CHLR|nr:hypothetical protein G4Y79_08285 [Phototrophicus methaneseepsis]